MTRDDIIRMAKEAGAFFDGDCSVYDMPEHCFEKFAALVAAAEREACAAIAEKELGNTVMLTSMSPKSSAAWNILFAIRARGEAKPYATQAAMVESQTQGRMQINPATGDVSIGAIRARG
jgi:hypothetical protein